MHKLKKRTAPASFLEQHEQPSHSYPTRFSSGIYRKSLINLYKCTFRISIRGPAVWKDLVGSTEKVPSSLIKTKMKNKLLNFENEVTFLIHLHLKINSQKQRLMVTTHYNFSR